MAAVSETPQAGQGAGQGDLQENHRRDAAGRGPRDGGGDIDRRLRYAAAAEERVARGGDPTKTKMMQGWLHDCRWTDEHTERSEFDGHRESASTQEVWRAGEAMAARNKRAAG